MKTNDELMTILLTIDGKGREAKESALNELLKRTRCQARNECISAIDAEEECDGLMSDAVWEDIKDNRYNAEFLIRMTIKKTKENIVTRILS